MQQAQITGEGMMPEISEDVLDGLFRDFKVKQWLAKDTFYLVKAEIEMNMELEPADLGYPDEEGFMKMDIFMSMLAYNYNQPVSITLPAEAADAIESSMMMPMTP